MSVRQVLLLVCAVPLTAAIIAAFWAMRHGEIAPVEPPDPGSIDSGQVRLGKDLAGIGACEVCHTAPGGAPYAGGLALPTPFGVIFSTNITPDPELGIGRWSAEAFRRAMRQGIDRDGRHLYPAFPYDSFTRATDEDLDAIYAYLMTVDPVHAVVPDNDLEFPFNVRLLLAGWNLLFLRQGELAYDERQDEEWNRGAYLVEGLGHCGACHSPRNLLGAVKLNAAFAGGEAEEWYVPPLNADAVAPIPWDQLQLVNYLFDGWDEDHGIAAGPMTPVVNHLYDQSENDVFAMATYLESWQRPALSDDDKMSVVERAQELDWDDSPEYLPSNLPEEPQLLQGMEVFRDQCSSCHKSGGGQLPVSLALTSTMNAPDPRNVIHIIFDGIRAPRGVTQRSMPSFGASITDDDIVDLLTYMRWHFTDKPAWSEVAEHVSNKRSHW